MESQESKNSGEKDTRRVTVWKMNIPVKKETLDFKTGAMCLLFE